MKIAHIADIHYCQTHLHWVAQAMAHAVNAAIAEGCEMAVIAGDSFDRGMSASEPAFAHYLAQVGRLADHMPVPVLQGTYSHDKPGMLAALRELRTKHPIIVLDGDEPQFERVLSAAGNVIAIGALPSINKGREDVREMGANAWTRAALSQIGDRMQDEPVGHARILITHGTVTGSVTESGYAMVSPDHEFRIEDLAAAECDAAMLGHIHKRQSWPNVLSPHGRLCTIAYSGSLTRLTLGQLDPAGFLIWEFIHGSPVGFHFHECPSRVPYLIEFPGPPDMDELRGLAETVRPEDAVRIRYTIDEEHAATVDKAAIRQMFDGVASLAIEPRVNPIMRVRSTDIAHAHTVEGKLRVWAKDTGSAADIGTLNANLAMLRSMPRDEIVARILSLPRRGA